MMPGASAWSGRRKVRAGLPSSRCFASDVADLDRELLDRVVRLWHLARAVDALADRLEVLEAQLHRHRLDVGDRVDAVLDVHDVRVLEAARDLHDRVDLADVRQELVAEPLALVRAAHEARDVDEVDRGRHDALGVHHGVERGEARIRHGHDADVRLDRAEGIVRRLGLGRRERVEERGLADVGEADDTDGKAHG